MGSGALPGPDLLAIPGASKVEGLGGGGFQLSLISRAVLASTGVPAQRSNFPFRGAALPPASHFRQGLSGCASATMRYLALAWAAAHALQHPGARRRRATPCAALSAADEFVVKVGVVDALPTAILLLADLAAGQGLHRLALQCIAPP